MRDQDILQDIVAAMWLHGGATPFAAAEVWAKLSPAARARVDRLISKDTVMREHAAVTRCGRILAQAVSEGARTGEGLGVLKTSKTRYHVVRFSNLGRIEVADRAESIENVRASLDSLDSIVKDINVLRDRLRALARAFERGGASEGIGVGDGELLSSIARARGDGWVGLRELRPFIGKGVGAAGCWLATVSRGGTAELQIEARVEPATSRRQWRVLLRE